MNGLRRKWAAAYFLCIAAACMLTGCVMQSETTPPLPQSSAAPPPVYSEEPTVFTADLYYITDINTLEVEQRQIEVPPGGSRAEAVLLALLAGPELRSLYPPIPNDANFFYEGMEISGDVCLVYFSAGRNTTQGNESTVTEEEFMRAKAAIAATMQAALGLQYTDLYIDNAPSGFRGRPLGALQPYGTDVNVVVQQYPPYQSENPQEVALENRDALLYFTDGEETLLLCENRPLQYGVDASIDEILSIVLSHLVDGPLSAAHKGILPADLRYANSTFRRAGGTLQDNASQLLPEEELTTFSSMPAWGRLSIYLESDAQDLATNKLACASIVNTITGFIPRILGLRIFINNQPVDVEAMLGIANPNRDNTFFRDDFKGMLGHIISLCYPDKTGLGLVRVPRLVPQDLAQDPLFQLQALFSGAADPGLPITTLSATDIRSVSIQGTLAVVNTKEGFYEKLNQFVLSEGTPLERPEAARLAVFSMVNTLCSLQRVDRVQFLEEGGRIEKSLGEENDLERLYLGNPLSYSPGLMP